MIVKKNEYNYFRINESEEYASFLTENKEYLVLGIEYSSFRIFDDHGEPVLCPYSFFEIIDCSCDDWTKTIDDAGEIEYYGYREFNDKYFFEDFFNGKKENIKIVLNFLKNYDEELMNKLIEIRFSPDKYKNRVKANKRKE